MRPDVHLEEQIPRLTTLRRLLALARKPQLLALRDARRNGHLHRVLAHLRGALRSSTCGRCSSNVRVATAKGLFQIDVDARVMIAALRWLRAGVAPPPPMP